MTSVSEKSRTEELGLRSQRKAGRQRKSRSGNESEGTEEEATELPGEGKRRYGHWQGGRQGPDVYGSM